MKDNDEDLQLSSASLLALQEFISEQESKAKQLNTLSSDQISMNLFTEDWQLSQFWYSDSTAEHLATLVRSYINKRAVFISSPSAFVQYFKKYPKDSEKIRLLEFDKRFKIYDQLVLYDYRNPLENIENSLEQSSADVILLDPPFLSEECMSKTMITVDYLKNENTVILVCSGAIMKPYLETRGIYEQEYKPTHRNRLSNEFRLYSNRTLRSQ